MFNFLKKTKSKPCIICIHGFGRRRSDEFLYLKEKLQDNYEIITPNIYNPLFTDDDKWYNWVSRVEQVVIEAKKTHDQVYLVGFSMGGVIASSVASKISVNRVIFLDAAFDVLTLTTAQQLVTKVFSKKDTTNPYPELPTSFTACFIDVVNNCKDTIEKVQCPCLFIHSSDDEVISPASSTRSFKKVQNKLSKCIILEGGQHRILDDELLKDTCLFLTKSFIEGQL